MRFSIGRPLFRHGSLALVCALATTSPALAATEQERSATGGERTAQARDATPEPAEVAAEVRARLRARLPDSAEGIRVRASGAGRVELTGNVDTLPGKLMAAETAENVRGVREVSNKLTVTPARRTNDEIARDVKWALKADPATTGLDLEVSARGGVVTLRGTVDTVPEKRVAAWVASGLVGVAEVKNEIRVAREHRRDADIRDALVSHYANSSIFNDDEVSVRVEAGVVELSGQVDTALERTWARADAWVPGVRQVNVDRLQVRPAPSLSQAGRAKPLTDEEIRQSIVKAFTFDARVASIKLDVDVADRVVTLRGDVASRRAREAAVQIAQNTGGVAAVIDQLNVKAERSRSDAEILAALQTALRTSAALAENPLQVDVQEGRVALTGVVDSAYEKWVASDLADRTSGVMQVDNQLNVARHAPEQLAYHVFPNDSLRSPWIYPQPAITEPRTDEQLADEVRRQLAWSPFTDGNDIAVSVSNGIVTLRGEVDSIAERRAAVANAHQAGAREVINDLRIVGVPRP